MLGQGVRKKSSKKLFSRIDKTKVTRYLRDDNDEVDMMTRMVIKMRFDDIIIDKPDKSYPPTIFLFLSPS